jgi:hypothetical protein
MAAQQNSHLQTLNSRVENSLNLINEKVEEVNEIATLKPWINEQMSGKSDF